MWAGSGCTIPVGCLQGVALDGRTYLLKRRQMNKEKLESAKNLFFIALGLDIAVTALVVISDFWGVGVLKDIGAGRITADQSTISTMEFWDSFAKLMLLTMLGVGLGLVKWLNTCYSYAKESLGASGFKNEGWTTGGWIIPIFNLFKPYQVINEIYKAGSPTYAVPDGWKKESGSGLLLAWWIFWAVTHFIGWVVGKQVFKSAMRDDMTLLQSIGAIEFHAWFCVVFLVVSGLWLVVAGSLTRRLLERKTTEDSSLVRGHSAAVASQAQVTPQMPKQPVTRPLNEGMPKRTTDFHFVGALAGEASSTALPTTITLSGSAMNTESSTEEDHWAIAMAEVDSGQRRPGVWAKAFAESEGDETKAKVAYLKSRVQQLTDAAKLIQAQQEATRQQEAEKAHAEALERKRTVDEAIATFAKNKELSNEQLTLIVQFADTPHLVSLWNSTTGNTLLHVCAERDMLVEVDALLKAGADPQRSNNNGKRPGFMAKSWTTRLLISGTTISVDQLKRAAEVGLEQDGDMFTFADHKFQALQEAIDYAIAVSKMPQAELRSAVLGGNWSAAKNLLDSGVSPLGKDVDGRTLLDHAKEKRDKLLIDLLEYHGAE